MVAEAMATSVVITCAACSTSITATEKSRKRAILTRNEDESLNGLEVQAVRIAARDADWEYDYDADSHDVWFCATCAAKVAAERKAPCPAWCGECGGYSFQAQGTRHRHCWRTDDGEYLGEVNQQVDADGPVVWTVVRLSDAGDGFDVREDLDRSLRLLTSITKFLDEHKIVLGGGE